MDSSIAQQLLQKVQQDYQKIAKEFSASREALWPELYQFLDFVKEGDRILDAGCGNGRLINLFKGRRVDYLGLDNVEAFVKIAREKCREADFKCQIILGDVLNLPFEETEFDALTSVAVLHHLPGDVLRAQALKEMRRVLKPNGILFLTVWNLWQFHYLLFVLKDNLKKFFGKSELDYNDTLIPFQNKIERYVHAFTLKELRELIKQAGFDVIESYYTKNNKKKHWWNGANIIIIARAK